MIRLKEAIKYYNIKVKHKNLLSGLKCTNGTKTVTDISVKIWPNVSRDIAKNCGSKLANGGYKSIKLEWLHIICEELNYEIDANFLVGMPSKHDKDFSQIVLKF